MAADRIQDHPPGTTFLGRASRYKYTKLDPHGFHEYWLPCMSCQSNFVSSTRSGHLKCYDCRDQSCACACCERARAETSALVDAGLYAEEMRP